MSNTVEFHGLHTPMTEVGNPKEPDGGEVFPPFTDFTPVEEGVYVARPCTSVRLGARASPPTRPTATGKSVKCGKSLYVKGCFHPTRCEVPREIHGVVFEEALA